MRSASLALYAGTMSFEALHALTGCHWLRLAAPRVPEPNVLAVRFWEVVAAFYAKIGRPALPDEDALEAWRALACPSDDAIRAAAVASDDEHDLSLVFFRAGGVRPDGRPALQGRRGPADRAHLNASHARPAPAVTSRERRSGRRCGPAS